MFMLFFARAFVLATDLPLLSPAPSSQSAMAKKASGPDLTKYIDKQLSSQCRRDTRSTREQTGLLVELASDVCVLLCALPPCAVKLNGNREVMGVLRGFDQFMNLVVEDTVEKTGAGADDKQKLGMVVLRGNSVLMIECLEKL